MRSRRDPGGDLVRTLLARLAQDPADGLADEELALVEHRIRATQESIERRAVADRPQLRQERGAADPEVVVGRPSVHDGRHAAGIGLDEASEHVPGEPVHQRPGQRFAHEPLDERQVGDPEAIGEAIEEEDRCHPALEHAARPRVPRRA